MSNENSTPLARQSPSRRRQLTYLAGMLAGLASWATEPSPFVSDGTEYAPAGSTLGDQLAPAVAFRGTGGWLVWHDNLTDGDGYGISARRLTGQLTGLSSVRVNQDGAGDQQNPQVALFPDGSALIVWQSGKPDAQKIIGRILKSDGQFAGGEFVISGDGTDHREPAIAVGKDGNALIVWGANGVDGSMQAVVAQRVSPSGQKLGASFTVNQYTEYHQRNPAVAALSAGGFVVSWISEQQRGPNTVDVYARLLGADGSPSVNEFLVDAAERPCATPTVTALPSGGFLAAWAEHDGQTAGVFWDIFARVYGANGPLGSPARVNTRQKGFQGMPKLAVTSDSVLAVYRSRGGDGDGEGVTGQWLTLDGQLLGDEFVVNTRTAGDQLNPTVASDGVGRAVAVWSTFGGSTKGMDLAAQRFIRAQAPLNAPAAPYVFAASSSKLLVTWPELSGLAVKNYELYVDGAEAPIAVTGGMYSLAGLAPQTSHSIQLAYVLQDGRQSPPSLATSGKTWGEDDNADGLPDDWEAANFGPDPAGWPLPNADSDGDGVSNRDEFLAGTDPNSAQSVLAIKLLATPQGPILTWNCRTGVFYQVQFSLNLRDWSNVGGPRLAAGETDSIAVGEVPPNAYYRVNLLR